MNPPWYDIALRELGVQEIPGDADNPRIVEYLKTVFDFGQHDEIAWCSPFANWCMLKAGFKGTHSALARSWLNYGVPLRVPIVGAILVFERGQERWMGHVCFFAGYNGSNYRVLGGNQKNRVCFDSLPKTKLLGIRWPENYVTEELRLMRAIQPTGRPDMRTPWRPKK